MAAGVQGIDAGATADKTAGETAHEALSDILRGQLPRGSAERRELHELGERLVGIGRFAEAAAVYQVLVAADPDSGFYHRAYGICCENLDRLDEARRALDRAIELEPGDAYARVSRASIAIREGDRAAALVDLRVAEASIADKGSALARRTRIMMKVAGR